MHAVGGSASVSAIGGRGVSISGSIGCAGSKSEQFRAKIQRMSDAELVSYYRGINERAKDIGNDMTMQEHAYSYDPKHNVYSTPFSPGREGYRLIQESRMIKEELNRRNIHP